MLTWQRTAQERPPVEADGISRRIWLYDEDGADIVIVGIYRRFQEEKGGPVVEEFDDLDGRVLLPSHWMRKARASAPCPPLDSVYRGHDGGTGRGRGLGGGWGGS
jgi:hypothetical protein